MSNYSCYDVYVLASNSAELNKISERLKQPSSALVNRVAESCPGQSLSEIAARLQRQVRFGAVKTRGWAAGI